jgi:hypothetical protein
MESKCSSRKIGEAKREGEITEVFWRLKEGRRDVVEREGRKGLSIQ